MKLHATLAGVETDVEIKEQDGRVLASVADRSYELEVHRRRDGYLLKSDSRVFDCRVEGEPTSGNVVDVFVGAEHYSITLTDPKRLRGAAVAGAHGDGAARITAPMPGKVVRLLVNVGDRVEPGAGIVVVEAMKMQNEMKSPKAGTVAAIEVEVGATVDGGDVLAIIE
jgi:biotin carboxyl carrier protein